MSTVIVLFFLSMIIFAQSIGSDAGNQEQYIQMINFIANAISGTTSIDCQELLEDITPQLEESRSCEDKYFDEAVEDTLVVKLDWTSSFNRTLRCYCGLSILQTLSRANVVELAAADPNINVCRQNGTVTCTEVCLISDNNVTFSCNPELQSRNCDKCLLYGALRMPAYEIELGGNMIQIVALIDGIACNTLSDYSRDICDFMFEEDSESKSDDSQKTYILAFSIPLGVIVFIALLAAIAYLVYKCMRRRRRKKLGFHTNELETVTVNQYHGNNIAIEQNAESAHGDKITRNSLFCHESLAKYRQLFAAVLLQPSDYKILEEVGEGAFGKVYKGALSRDNSEAPIDIAIKTLKDPTLQQAEEFISESIIMLGFDHPNVLSLLGVCFDTEQNLPLIILPYMANGDLKTFLLKCRGDNEPYVLPTMLASKDLFLMCLDIARGMSYLAQKKFVHRDLAARNCMIDKELNVKVADFGFSRDIYSADYYRLERKTRLPVKWLPPECLLDNKYDVKTDVWSFGIVCWEIFSLGRVPYPGLDNADIPEYIVAGNRLKQPSLCPDEMFSLICQCWDYVPGERPSFAEIVSSLEKQLVVIHDTLAHENEINSSEAMKDKPYFVLENSNARASTP